MTKQIPKTLPILQKEGLDLPEEFYELLIHLEETVKKTIDTKVKLSPTNQKSLKSLQVKLRKILKTYEKQINEIKEVSANVLHSLISYCSDGLCCNPFP